MKALIKDKKAVDHINLVDIDKPKIKRNEVLIKVKAAGLCGTDIHIKEDQFNYDPPVIIGHEISGIISEVGNNVKHINVGDRVTTETYFYTCGNCSYCKKDASNLCKERRSIGSLENGAFAEYLKSPAENVHILPENITFEEGALIEPLSCCINGMISNRSVIPGDFVLIFGPGAIGLICLQLAKLMGGEVIVVGTRKDAERLKVAKKLGADYTMYFNNDSTIKNRLNIEKDIDVVIEASGASEAVREGLKIIKKSGKYIQMGLVGRNITLNWDDLVIKEIDFWGPNATIKSNWDLAIRLLEQEKINLSLLISKRYKLNEWEKAFENFKNNKGIKNIFVP